MFHECNTKLQSSDYRDYCLTDTCAYAAADVCQQFIYFFIQYF